MRKSRWLAWLLSLAVTFSLTPRVAMSATPSPMAFWDVVGGTYDAPVRALYELGLIAGTSANTFSPEDPVTRAQMAALLIRALKMTDSVQRPLSQKFDDVPNSFWAFGEIMLAERLGIIRGVSETSFQPNAQVTYPQAVVMTIRALGYDTGAMEYPTGYILKANELGLLSDLKWDLSGTMKRGEVAVLLANAVFKVPHAVYGVTLSQQLFNKPVSIQIGPADEFLVAGETQLSVQGLDAYGKPLQGIQASWRLVSGMGSISGSGLISAVEGPVIVEATYNNLKTTRQFSVISKLELKPASSTAKPGEKVQFTATAAGQPNLALKSVRWSVVSGPGTITQNGLLTISGNGEVKVQATLGTLSAQASVTSVSAIAISPVSPVLLAGEKVKFLVVDGNGNPYTGVVTWSVEGAGSITADGTYTAASGSPPKVKASVGAVSATTSVQVVHRLAVSPSGPVSVLKGKTVEFSAKGVTSAGDEVTIPITWSSTGRNGIIGATGVFVGTQSGTGQVTATAGSLTQTVTVSVSGDPYTVALTASRNSVPANGRSEITLTATVKDSNGLTVNIETPIQFLISDPTKGSLTTTTVKASAGVATTTFLPSTLVGSFRITAAATDLAILAGYLDLSTTAPVPAKIRLESYPNPVASAANSRSSITATLLDNEGYAINAPTTQIITLTFNNATAASLTASAITIPAGQSTGQVFFNAGNPGSTLIVGAANYPVESVTVETRQVSAATKVALRSNISDTKADGSAEMVIYAEVQDANGVVRTQDHGVAVTLSGATADGLSTIPAQITTTVSGIATFRIRSTKAGTYTFTAVSSGLASGQGQGTFLPGTPTGLKLSVLPVNNIAADATSTVRLRAEIVDANSNLVPSAAATITFTKTINNNATALPATSAVTAVGGVAEIMVTSTVYPATDTFKASASNLADSNTATVTTRITGVPAKVVAEVSAGSAAVGTPVQVKVYLQDSLNQVVTAPSTRIARLVPSSSTATVTGSGVFESGVATFTVTDSRSSVVTLSATSDGLSADNSKAISFVAGPVAKIRLKLSSPEMSADAGLSYVQLTAEAEDSYGNKVNQAIPITLSTNNTAVATLGSNSLYTGNLVLVRSTNAPGTATISGTSSVTVESVTLTTHVPAAPGKLVVESVTNASAGVQATFRVKLLDVNGHMLTGMNTGSFLSAVGVILTGTGGNTQTVTNSNLYGLTNFQANGVTHGSAAISGGIATFTYLNNKAETLNITPVGYYNGVPLAVESGQITTNPGAPVKLTVTSTRTGLSTSTPESANVEAVMTDAYSNVVTTSEPDTFTFSLSGNTYLTSSDVLSIKTNTGRATVQLTSRAHSTGGSTTITVTSAKTGFTGATTIVTDNPPASPILFATDNLGLDTTVSSGEAGVRLVITAETRNSSQTVIAYVNGLQVPLYASSSGGTQANTILAGQTTLVAYILRADLGTAGSKTIRVVLQNAVAASSMSNAQTITLQ